MSEMTPTQSLSLSQFLRLDTESLSKKYNKAKCLTGWFEITDMEISEDNYINVIRFCSTMKKMGCWFDAQFKDRPYLSERHNLNWP